MRSTSDPIRSRLTCLLVGSWISLVGGVPGRYIYTCPTAQAVPIPYILQLYLLRQRPVHAGVARRLGQLRAHAEVEPRGEADGPQHPQRVVEQRRQRREGRSDDAWVGFGGVGVGYVRV